MSSITRDEQLLVAYGALRLHDLAIVPPGIYKVNKGWRKLLFWQRGGYLIVERYMLGRIITWRSTVLTEEHNHSGGPMMSLTLDTDGSLIRYEHLTKSALNIVWGEAYHSYNYTLHKGNITQLKEALAFANWAHSKLVAQ